MKKYEWRCGIVISCLLGCGGSPPASTTTAAETAEWKAQHAKTLAGESCAAIEAALVKEVSGRTVWFRAPLASAYTFHEATDASAADMVEKEPPQNLVKLTVKTAQVRRVDENTPCSGANAAQYVSLVVTDGTSSWRTSTRNRFTDAEETVNYLGWTSDDGPEPGHIECFDLNDPVPAGVSKADRELLRKGEVRIGMKKPLALLALGKAIDTKTVTTAGKVVEEVLFSQGDVNVWVSFQNDAIVQIRK